MAGGCCGGGGRRRRREPVAPEGPAPAGAAARVVVVLGGRLSGPVGGVVVARGVPVGRGQPGEHAEEQEAHGRHAGADDAHVDLDGRPEADGEVVPGRVGRGREGDE